MCKHCTVPMEILEDENGGIKYIYCNGVTTHQVEGSDWYVCEAHANTMKAEGRWKLIPLTEVNNERKNVSRCRSVSEVAERERETCSCGQEGSSCCQN